MVTTTLALPRLVRDAERRLGGVAAVTSRNLVAVQHSGYWLVVLSGFFEPVLYLFSIGVGVGSLIDGFTLANGRVITYAQFVAPAMLASSAMTGAMSEATFNFFARLKWMHLYDAMVATPLTPFQIATGELGWALLRGAMYGAAFLGIMVAMSLTTAGWALATLPAALLVGFAFGAAGMAISTLLRTWQDFDYLFVVQFALFLFSGTFAPADSYPPVLRVIVELTPLYHSVELVRGLSTGSLSWSLLGHTLYLVALAIVGLAVAGRRMAAMLCK